jgi:ABC-type multidrug transport system ATPase subunit
MIDEMSQGLAPTVVRQLFEIVRVFREQGIAVLLVEQFVESALGVADRAYVFEHGTIGLSGEASELAGDRKLVAGSYLGTAVEEAAAVDGNGDGNGHHHLDPALMEVIAVRLPAKVKRALEQRAEAEGRPAGAVAIELLRQVNGQ